MNGSIVKELYEGRQLYLYVPPSYLGGSGTYPVMYVQDGMDLFDPQHSPAIDQLERWFAEGQLPELILVGVEPKERHNEYTPWYSQALSSQRPHDDFHGRGSEYLSFLAERCKPYIDSKYRTKPEPEHTGIIGFSLGGLISMYAAHVRPEVFRKIGSMSGSYWYEGMVDYIKEKRLYHSGLRIYMDVGSEEGSDKANIQKQMVPFTKEVHRLLSESGFTQDQLTLRIEQGANHRLPNACGRFAEALQWLWTNRRENDGTGQTAAGAPLDSPL